MIDKNEIRESVSKDYARAVTSKVGGAGACCGAIPAQKGVVAKLALWQPRGDLQCRGSCMSVDLEIR